MIMYVYGFKNISLLLFLRAHFYFKTNNLHPKYFLISDVVRQPLPSHYIISIP